MNIGDVIESAIWITGDESPELRSRYEQDVRDAISYLCDENGFCSSPVVFIEKHPMEDIPEVPDHISGSRVRLLVGESVVIKRKIDIPAGSFVANLELKDLQKLREIIKKYRPMTDSECDRIIEEIGPQAVLDTLH